MKKRALTALILSFIMLLPVSGMSAETIYHAPLSALKSMADLRGLPTEGSEDEIRDRLYAYFGYEKVTITQEVADNEEENESYTLTFVNANTVSSEGGVITAEGNVEIVFDFSNRSSKTLTASTVIVDSSSSILTAIGDALYIDGAEDASIKEIKADVLTVKWDRMDIFLTEGSTSTTRENSEKKKVTFSTSAEKLSYLSEGAVIFDEGSITSNPRTAYSSISASTIMILPGEDMFLSSATFNIGRVPIFYLPFFFFPGSRILGNPSFGFSSSKGAFVNMTFELVGSYPEIESTDESSSFSSLLKSTSDTADESINGYYYSSGGTKSELEKAASDTQSYLVLMADAYKGGNEATLLKNGGLHLALKGQFNLFENNLKISLMSGVATPLKTDERKTRYHASLSVSFSRWGLNADIKAPFYSDQSVLYHYGNRLTGFSYGPLMGGKSTFPTDYSSSLITSFTRSLVLSYSLPSSLRSSLLSSFSIKNFSIEGNYSLSSSSDRSILSSYSLPSFSVSLSGKLLSFTSEKKTNETVKTESEADEKSEKDENSDDILLIEPYEVEEKTKTETDERGTKESAFLLSYTITEDFTNTITRDTVKEEDKEGKISNTLYSRLTVEGNIGTVLTFSDVFTSSLSYSLKNSYSAFTETEKLTAQPLNTLKITSPSAGLTYTFQIKPFEYSEEDDSSLLTKFEFTKKYVTAHSVSFSKAFTFDENTLTGELSVILPPLDSTITPSLRWKKRGFSSSLTWLMKEDEDSFRGDKLTLSLSYSSSYFLFSSSVYYQTDEYEKDDFFRPLSLTSTLQVRSEDSKYYAEGKITGDGDGENFITGADVTVKIDEVKGIVTFRKSTDFLEFESLNLVSNLSTKSFQLWKGRIYIAFALDSTLFLSHKDRTLSYMTVKPSLTLSVAEFIDVVFSFTSQNTRLGSYYDGDDFSVESMWNDFLRSVDFFSGGRYNTSFVLQNASLSLVHYMEDWNLNFSYSTSFQKSSNGGKTIYTLQPSFSVYLAWNTMPDLKVEENWTKDSSGSWTRK